MAGPTRRGVLALAASGAATLAGCSSVSGDGGSGDGARLRRVDIINRRDEAVTVDVQVEADGDPVFWREYHLDARDGQDPSSAQVERAWPDSTGEFLIEARIEGTTRIRSVTYSQGDCLDVLVNVNDDGIGFFSGEAENCGAETATTAE